MELNEEILREAKEGFTNLKNKGYNNIVSYNNPKKEKDCLCRIEKTERIGLRGVELKPNKQRPNGMLDIFVGHKTNNNIIENILIPLVKQYNAGEEIITILKDNIQIKYVNGFRNNLTTLLLKVYFKGGSYLIQSDKENGVNMAQSLQNEILLIDGTLGEKKCTASEKSLYRKNRRRLKTKLDN